MELHRALNRYDVSKDAKESDTSITSEFLPFFESCATELFGPPRLPYTSALLSIKNDITAHVAVKELSNIRARDTKVALCPLQYPEDPYIYAAPPFITHAIHDAGYSPSYFNKDIQYRINPGSVLDSANKTPTGTMYGFNIRLRTAHFRDLGMPHINSFESTYNSSLQQFQVKIDTTFNTIRTTFDKTLKPIGGDTQYFGGNAVKNRWFNTTAASRAKEQAYSYILCKELGDTLQAVFGAVEIQKNAIGPHSLCLFTNDNVLTQRCRLLEVPVIVTDTKTKLPGWIASLYYPAPGITEEVKKYFVNRVIIRNNAVIAEINKILDNPALMYPIHINRRVEVYLRRILNDITKRMFEVVFVDAGRHTMDSFRKAVSGFNAKHLFSRTPGGTMAAEKHVLSLFEDGIGTFGDGLPFDEKLAQLASQSGGAEDMEMSLLPEEILEKFRPKKLTPEEAYYGSFEWIDEWSKDGDDKMENERYDTQLFRRMFLLVRKAQPEWPRDKIRDHSRSMTHHLIDHFNYVGEFTIDEEFLALTVDRFLSPPYGITRKVFEPMFYEYKAAKMKEEGIEPEEEEPPPEPEPAYVPSLPEIEISLLPVHGGKRKTKKRRGRHTKRRR